MLTNINAAFFLLEQSYWEGAAQQPLLHVGCSNLSNLLSYRLQTHAEQQRGTSGSEVLAHDKHLIISTKTHSCDTGDPSIGEWAGAHWTSFLYNSPPAGPSRSWCKAPFFHSYFQHAGRNWNLKTAVA